MATTFVEYTGDGQASKQFTFPSYQESDVKVRVDGVLKTTSTHYNITNYTTTGGGFVVFTSGNIPSSPANIRIYRDTNVDTAKATFTAGSSVKAADLNNNNTQLLYRAQEEQIPNLIHSWDIDDGAISTAKLAADAVDGTKIANDSINSEHYAGTSIDTEHIADAQITTAKLAADAVTSAKIADDAIDSEHIGDGAINSSAMLADNVVTTAKIAANSVTNSEIATATVLSGNIANGNINTAKIQDGAVTSVKIAADAIDSSKIADDAIDSEHIGNGAINSSAMIANNVVTSAEIANNTIVEGNIADSQVTANKIGTNAVTTTKIADNAVSTAKIADSELKTLAGMQSATASNLASSTALTATTAELNQLDGITLETSLTSSDTRIPTSKAVNDQILAVTNALGGFVAIADETSFPATNPDPSNGAGTVVSISEVSSGSAVTINNSGVATIANGAGTGNTVTITGFPTTLRNTSLAASSGLQVQTTTTLHTYTFHKQLASAADIAAISATVNSFSNRYRVSSSAPTSSLDGGDLWYDTTNSKLMVYSSQNSAWEESSAIGNFFISTISSSSNTGGGSATPNGTAYRFTISNAPPDAQQLLVSVDGVIQKPNSGSSQPSEGFVLVGNDIIFGAAPANGASLFVTVIGSTVGIGTPSNNTVTTAILQNGSVTTAKIVDANVTTAKIAKPLDFADNEKARFGSGNDLELYHDGTNNILLANSGDLNIRMNSSENSIVARQNGAAELYHDNSKKFETLSTGVNVTGNLGIGTTSPTGLIDARATTGATIQCQNTSSNIGKIGINVGSAENFLFSRGALSSDKRQLTFMLGNSIIAKFTTGQNFIPGADSAHDLGANTVRWRRLYADTLYGDGSNLTGINTDLVADTSPQLGGNLASNGNNINIADSTDGSTNRLTVGSGGDLQVFHDGSNSFIEDSGTGSLFIESNSRIRLRDNTGNVDFAQFINGGGVELYHNNNKKFETLSTGASVSGNFGMSGYFTGHFVPVSNNTYSLGNSSYKWSAVHATTYYGDGSNLTGVTSTTINNNANNRIITGSGTANTLEGESTLTFDGTNLQFGAGRSARFTSGGGWSGNSSMKIEGHNNFLYITGGTNGIRFRDEGSNDYWDIDGDGHFKPITNNQVDIGSTSQRVRNIYTNDLHLSNNGSSNDMDGTWGDWTIQEGESDLFLKNNRSGKKYKFNLTEVS